MVGTMRRLPTLLAVLLLCALCAPALTPCLHAQTPAGSSQSATEPSSEAKIAQLEAAKKGLARQAREATGYHESLRRMKIVKIDKLIARLKRGEDVPQSKIDRTIGHSSLPLYKPPGS